MEEIWKDVVGFEGLYEVSNLGRCRKITNFGYKIVGHISCQTGYVRIKQVNEEGQNKWYNIHRFVAQSFIPNSDNKCCVNHKDFNRANNNIENLEWVTTRENSYHAIEHGHVKKIVDHKFTEGKRKRFGLEVLKYYYKLSKIENTGEFLQYLRDTTDSK